MPAGHARHAALQAAAGERTGAIRAIVTQIITIAGTVLLVFYILVLTSTLLPSLRVVITLVVLIGLIAWSLRRSFIRVYSKAQAALEETLKQPPPAGACREGCPIRAARSRS